MEKEEAKALVMEMTGWTETEFNDRQRWAEEQCVCGTCPSYGGGERLLAFCWPTVGQSEVIVDEKNCVCGRCPVFNESNLRFAYYCTRDSEIYQMIAIRSSEAA